MGHRAKTKNHKNLTQALWRQDNPEKMRDYQDKQNKKRREARAAKRKSHVG